MGSGDGGVAVVVWRVDGSEWRVWTGRGSGSERRQRVGDESKTQVVQPSPPDSPPGTSVIAMQEESCRPMERGCPCARPGMRVELERVGCGTWLPPGAFAAASSIYLKGTVLSCI